MRNFTILLVFLAGILWAANGVVAQHLFTISSFTASQLTNVRLFFAGCIFLLLSLFNSGFKVFLEIEKKDILKFVILGIFGIFFMQYSYFKSIQTGNAATATVIQFTAPVLVVLYLALSSWSRPRLTEIISSVSAVFGIFLIVTGGNIYRLTISLESFFWGIVSAFMLAFYTIYPVDLLKKYSPLVLLGFCMLFASIFGLIFLSVPDWNLFLNEKVIYHLIFVVLFGTIVPFYLFLKALKVLSPTDVSVFVCIEPFAAVIFSVIFLDMTFSFGQLFGVVFVVGAIVLLALSKELYPL